MKWKLLVIAGIILLFTTERVFAVGEYRTTCSVSAAQASVSVSAADAFLMLDGPVRLTLTDSFHRVVAEQRVSVNASSQSGDVTRLLQVEVPWTAMHCNVDMSEVRVWANGMLVQSPALTPAVVEHHHYHHGPPVVTTERYPTRSTQVIVQREAPPPRQTQVIIHREAPPKRVVVVEREKPRRSRHVDKVIIRREEPRSEQRPSQRREIHRHESRRETRREQKELRVHLELPVMRASL